VTTTLRPAGPEQRHAATAAHSPARSRCYDICVNGRRVGAVEIRAAEERGLRTGRITRLLVDEADRRKGRATVALLAAEEVLRGWGCGRAVVAVPAAAGPALRLAAALGYTERSRHLLKAVQPSAAASAPPEGCSLQPMTDRHYRAWLARDSAQLVDLMTAEGIPPDRAVGEAERAQRALLPAGPETSGMAFRRLLHHGTGVGTLLLRLDGAPRADAEAWVYAVEVAEGHRGRGHGRTLMHAAEETCRDAGRRVLGLNVHSGNTPARTLYASLGYRPAEHLLGKVLL
jgi:GNAT superfamily N-acetyltransferase